jgi:NiFe hydrogenase
MNISGDARRTLDEQSVTCSATRTAVAAVAARPVQAGSHAAANHGHRRSGPCQVPGRLIEGDEVIARSPRARPGRPGNGRRGAIRWQAHRRAVGLHRREIALGSQSVLSLERLLVVKEAIDELAQFITEVYTVNVAAIAAFYPEWTKIGRGVTSSLRRLRTDLLRGPRARGAHERGERRHRRMHAAGRVPPVVRPRAGPDRQRGREGRRGRRADRGAQGLRPRLRRRTALADEVRADPRRDPARHLRVQRGVSPWSIGSSSYGPGRSVRPGVGPKLR